MGLNLGKTKVSFLFAKFCVKNEYERVEKTLAEGQPREA